MLEKFSYFGFAVADLDGPTMTVRYYDEVDECAPTEDVISSRPRQDIR